MSQKTPQFAKRVSQEGDNTDSRKFTKDVVSMCIERCWIPVRWHSISENERKTMGSMITYVFDGPMPDNEQEILVTHKEYGVSVDTCCYEEYYSLESDFDWRDITAWMPMPSPYDGKDNT